MTWAFYSDVHANYEALEAVIADFARKDVSRSFFLGDAVGYGASPNECVEQIAAISEVRLLGNHDEAALNEEPPGDFNQYAKTAMDWTRATLDTRAKAIMQTFTIGEVREGFCLAHGSPDQPEQWNYVLDQVSAGQALSACSGQACLVGHTHQPLFFYQNGEGLPTASAVNEFELEQNKRYVVNVGSVGQPRDGDPRAGYVLYDPEKRRLQFRRVAYNIKMAQEKIRQAGLPEFLASRLAMGR